MKKWMQALAQTRNALLSKVARLFTRPASDAAAAEEWEEALIRADVPAALAAKLVAELHSQPGATSFQAGIEAALIHALGPQKSFGWQMAVKPTVVLIAGVNGSGKTTTSAKLAHLARSKGLVPLLAATDTFRAAGADQLRIWAGRVECDVVAGAQGSDAAAVAYDAVSAAVARRADIVFVDTAGRMHTKPTLMNELGKIKRAAAKSLPGAPHETWLVRDAMIGQNALAQAKTFHEAVGLTGIVITKLDGSAKAGAILAVQQEIGVPILFVGLGEGLDDLVAFNPHEFVSAMLGTGG